MHQLKKSSKNLGKKAQNNMGGGICGLGWVSTSENSFFIGLGCAGAYEPDPISVLVKLNAISH